MPDSAAALCKTLSGFDAIREKSDGMLLPAAGFVNDFRHNFLEGPFIGRGGKSCVAEYQKICNVLHGIGGYALATGAGRLHSANRSASG